MEVCAELCLRTAYCGDSASRSIVNRTTASRSTIIVGSRVPFWIIYLPCFLYCPLVQCLPGPARICSSAATFEQWVSATNYDEF